MRFNVSRFRGGAWCVVVAAAAAAWLAPTASAGTMKHWICSSPNSFTPTHNSDGWSGGNNGVSGGNTYANCSGGGGSNGITLDMSNVTNPMGPGAGVSYTYTAPEGTSIGTAHLQSYSGVYGTDPNASMGIVLYRGAAAYDGDHVIAQCQRHAGCTALDTSYSEYSIAHYPVNSPVFIASMVCGSGVGAGCAGGYRGYMFINSGWLDLIDNSAPAAGTASGTVVQDAVLRGVETLAVPLTDRGVGVSDVEIRIGDTVVLPRQRLDDNGGRCVPLEDGYAFPVPCKTQLSASLNVNTASASDGSQLLTMTVWDAAGNPATAVSRRVTLDNKLPPRLSGAYAVAAPTVSGDSSVGGTLTATTGTWLDAVSFAHQWQVSDDGTSGWKLLPSAASDRLRPEPGLLDKFVRVAVTASNSEGSATAFSAPRRIEPANSGGGGVVPKPAPKTAADLVPNNGEGGDPRTGRLVPSRKRKSARVAYGKSVRIEGRVVDGAGRPLIGAQIDVFEQIKVKGSSARRVASIRSDKKGRYSYKPKTRSNRTVQLSYSRQRGASIYQSTHELALQVRAGVTLRADDTSIPSFGRVTLRGRVLSSDLPKQGVVVQVRARDGRRWLKVGNPRTNSKGQFTWKWKFDKVRRGTVPFQVRVLRTGDLPAMTNESRTVRVRIG